MPMKQTTCSNRWDLPPRECAAVSGNPLVLEKCSGRTRPLIDKKCRIDFTILVNEAAKTTTISAMIRAQYQNCNSSP
jgi:hypothetical protein